MSSDSKLQKLVEAPAKPTTAFDALKAQLLSVREDLSGFSVEDFEKALRDAEDALPQEVATAFVPTVLAGLCQNFKGDNCLPLLLACVRIWQNLNDVPVAQQTVLEATNDLLRWLSFDAFKVCGRQPWLCGLLCFVALALTFAL